MIGEARGQIRTQVINEYRKFLQVGSILVLRNPSVLKWNSSYVVTVTKSSLAAIVTITEKKTEVY